VIDAMCRLRPDAAPILSHLAEEVCSGRLCGPHAFGQAISRSLGGTILLDALLLLRGAPMTTASSDGDAKLRARLLEHSIQCRAGDQCCIPGCTEMRSLVHMLDVHRRGCQEKTGCVTCARWTHIQNKVRQTSARPVCMPVAKPVAVPVALPVATLVAKPIVAKRVVPDEEPRVHKPKQSEPPPRRSALEMLARSALGELSVPSSPRNSPRNSPVNSPNRVRLPATKRQKKSFAVEQARPHSPLRATLVGRHNSPAPRGSRLAQ
jgi:hypothetical protein